MMVRSLVNRHPELMCPGCRGEMKPPRFASVAVAIGEGVFWLVLFAVFALVPAVSSGFRAFAIGAVAVILLAIAVFVFDRFILLYRCSECGVASTRHALATRYPNGHANH